LSYDERARSGRFGGGLVAGAVVDDDAQHRVAAHVARRARDDVADTVLFVPSREEEHDRTRARRHQGTLTMVRLT
jgi:hypothetical protein